MPAYVRHRVDAVLVPKQRDAFTTHAHRPAPAFRDLFRPIREQIAVALGGNFRTMLALLVIVLSGELVWRDRALRTADAVLSARSGTLQRLLAQIVALWICTLLFFSLGVAFAGSWSLAFGGTLVPLDFLAGTLSMLTPPLLLAAAALGLQYATGNKYFGTALSLVVLATHFLMLEKVPVSPFLRAGILPSRSYSDLVGFGPSWGVWSLYALYWAAACAFVVFSVVHGWPRVGRLIFLPAGSASEFCDAQPSRWSSHCSLRQAA